jgi:arsenate reductase
MLKVYAYSGCSTCKNAIKWLKGRGVEFEEMAIRETPPTVGELKGMLGAQGGVRCNAILDQGRLFS